MESIIREVANRIRETRLICEIGEEEMAACRPWLDRQIALVRPKLIVSMRQVLTRTQMAIRSRIAQTMQAKMYKALLKKVLDSVFLPIGTKIPFLLESAKKLFTFVYH